MDKNSLEKIIKLIQKTGDKIIVLNEGEPNLVMMSFKDYEKLVFNNGGFKDLTKEELVDKMNREIAFYKAEQGEQEIEEIKQEAESEKLKTEEIIETKQEINTRLDGDYEIEPIK